MDFNCRLEIVDDTEGFYVGPAYDKEGYFRGDQKVEAKVGGDELMFRTVELFKDWVEHYDEQVGRPELRSSASTYTTLPSARRTLPQGRPFNPTL
jgi:hypothetical protein